MAADLTDRSAAAERSEARLTVRNIIRVARGTQSQKEFCQCLQVSQGSLSRYESGESNPPARVIEHCLRLVHTSSISGDPLMRYMHTRLDAMEADVPDARVRAALACLLDYITRSPAK